jgi:hypothetical protein
VKLKIGKTRIFAGDLENPARSSNLRPGREVEVNIQQPSNWSTITINDRGRIGVAVGPSSQDLVKICNGPIEPAKIAVVPAHVREPVEEVDRTRSRSHDWEPVLGRGGGKMRSAAESEVEWRRLRWRRGRGVHGAALAGAARGVVSDGGELCGGRGGGVGEIGLGLGAAELAGGVVVSTRGLLSGVKRAEPNTGLLPRVPDLRSVPAPGALPHASESDLLGGRRCRVNGSGSFSGSHNPVRRRCWLIGLCLDGKWESGMGWREPEYDECLRKGAGFIGVEREREKEGVRARCLKLRSFWALVVYSLSRMWLL